MDDHKMFKASLLYIVSSRPARCTCKITPNHRRIHTNGRDKAYTSVLTGYVSPLFKLESLERVEPLLRTSLTKIIL